MSVIPQTPRASGGLCPTGPTTIFIEVTRTIYPIYQQGMQRPTTVKPPPVPWADPGFVVRGASNPQSFRGALPHWAHYQGSALDPLGTLSGLQTPRLLTPPLTTNPGSAPGYYSSSPSSRLLLRC
jgi:hypothetical protein